VKVVVVVVRVDETVAKIHLHRGRKGRPMEALDAELLDAPEKPSTLLPDGTVCYAAAYSASKPQFWYGVALVALSPGALAMLCLGSSLLQTFAVSLLCTSLAGLIAWHAARFRRYTFEVRAGCHMQGIFLFTGTRDVVFRFHRPLGVDLEASFAKDTVIHVDVRKRFCRDCVVVENLRSPTAPARIVVPAAWLRDDPYVVVASIRDHLQLESSSPRAFDYYEPHGLFFEGSYDRRLPSPSSSYLPVYNSNPSR